MAIYIVLLNLAGLPQMLYCALNLVRNRRSALVLFSVLLLLILDLPALVHYDVLQELDLTVFLRH